MDKEQSNKSHHKTKVGSKANKRNAKHKKNRDPNQQNFKAFTVANVRRRQRDTQHLVDKSHRRHVAPVFNPEGKSLLTPPPICVAFHGPKGVGKSLAMKCLVKKWTRQSVSIKEKSAPITVVTGKNKRLTLLECPSGDLDASIDIAKVADLVLIFINAEKGFEMETFEMLNILQVHGMTKVLAVLTHLDKLKSLKAVRETKKKLKDRFWEETFAGNKMFYLSKLKYGKYLKNEVANLGRFITLAKFRPLTWRINHSYLVVDRFELNKSYSKATNSDKKELVVFGYLRGTSLRQNENLHLLGFDESNAVGYKPDVLEVLEDPCPLPMRLDSRFDGQEEKITKGRLKDKEKLIYAPMANIGSVMYDKDAVYINLPDKRRQFTKKSEVLADDVGSETEEESEEESSSDEEIAEGVQLVRNLQEFDADVEKKQELRLIEGGEVVADAVDEQENRDLSEESEDGEVGLVGVVGKKALEMYKQRVGRKINIMEEIYGSRFGLEEKRVEEEEESDEDDDQGFFQIKNGSDEVVDEKKGDIGVESGLVDSTVVIYTEKNFTRMRDWADKDVCELIRDRFVTGSWNSKFAEEEFGEFEDLEEKEEELEGSQKSDTEEEEEEELNDVRNVNESVEESRKRLAEAKSKKKALFNLEYDQGRDMGESLADKNDSETKLTSGKEEVDFDDEFLKRENEKKEVQQSLNKTEFADVDPLNRQEMEGIKPGSYLRICFDFKTLKIDYPIVDKALGSLKRPLILGGLNLGEQGLTYVHCRIRRHRWWTRPGKGKNEVVPAILKSNDPLVFSFGWRRFQSLPIYYMYDKFQSTSELASKRRFLKYTPEHMHCQAVFYGPKTMLNTPILCYQPKGNVQSGQFRICATGISIQLDNHKGSGAQVLKKLKLIGEPYDIKKNSCFIKSMFTSELEAAKFTGARLQTVSGIRGVVKKAVGKDGSFRATFEHKLRVSDLVFCKTWTKVAPEKFYNPIRDIIYQSIEERSKFLMKTVGDLRQEKNLEIKHNPDSFYKHDEEEEEHKNKLSKLSLARQKEVFQKENDEINKYSVPKSLAKRLPFNSKIKAPKFVQNKKQVKENWNSNLAGEQKVELMSSEEKKVYDLMEKLRVVQKEKSRKRQESKVASMAKKRKLREKYEERFIQKKKDEKKKKFRAISQAEKYKQNKLSH
eukprot:snap_masked-scaffold_25-processed-gene-1.16-mRNA-1 protein AED:0.00 eAED:0.00 QI:0/-1/0/1/-1/1/1/0/1165